MGRDRVVILTCAYEKAKISFAKTISSLCFSACLSNLKPPNTNYATLDKFRLTSLSEYLSMRT